MNKIIIFYLYRKLENIESLRDREKAVCNVLELKGRIVLAEEGINGTLEGNSENIEKYKKHILSDRRFVRMIIKESKSQLSAFPHLKILIKEEIVATKFPKSINPSKKTGKYIRAYDLKKIYENEDLQKELVIIDMRNNYETMAGKFKNSLTLPMQASRDLPSMMSLLSQYKNKKVLTVCTAGVRCEKMSAYLIDQGFADVSQLQNGIHGYMEEYPGEDFEGTLYTFDDRLTMDFGGDRKIIGQCYACVNKTENYIHCSNGMCHKEILMCHECLKIQDKYTCDKC